MPEPITPVAAPAAAPVTTPALAATTTTPEPLAGDGTETISLEDARKLRSEAQALRKRLKGYEDADTAAKEAALSEVDKANKRAIDAEKQIQQYRDQLIHAEVKIAAAAKGIIDPDLAALAIKDALEFGEDGMPTNLEKALTDLIKAKPYLAPKPAEAPPASPAQTANVGNPPALPNMNPGRTNITQPGANPPGHRASLFDPGLFKR